MATGLDGIERAGRFITFEGGEGAGKSTQIKRLAARLREKGLVVVLTREPGGTTLAESVRAFILSGAAEPLGPEAEMVLFAAARADHVDRVIGPALARGEWVLCDRFIDSTRAYQGGDGVDPDLLNGLEALAIDGVRPDLTLMLDLPVEIGLARAARRRDDGDAPDRFERETVERHERRRQVFLSIATANPDRCVVIDANRSEEEVAEAVWQVVLKRFADRLG
ncbi:dTMP kinase [Kaistia dalseonensis]|uniref:Thymidylate kinase n=1 Tax=Kaistia dalseonensis TaxID=410840 RepID=A0ABU0H3V5_9HYPH|nr:dTMP kinase [Kaistia dalseonensis]MCX5493997.1 dTMP kinase [Kaistia dalseonensis]MDQ0436573.1 dTMP kinase [Kaistia dalseonensis]